MPPHENWGFAKAALELRRLPPIAAVHDSSDPESSESAIVLTAQAVSFSELDGSDQPDLWDDHETRLYLGYDRGFVIAADQPVGSGASSADFLMRVNSWMQLRHTLFESDGPDADQNTLSFERLRLSFGGHVLSPDLKYFFQFDGNSDRSTDAIFLDYFASYDLGSDRFGLDENKLGIKLGKWKVPFSRSRQESGRLLQFSDRAMANIFFDLNRSLGVGLYGRLDHLAKPIHFETAVFNGFGTGSVSTNRSDAMDGLDRNFGWSLRGQTDLLGEFGNDGEPDLSWHVAPSLRLGGGLAFTRVDSEGPSEFRWERVVDSGAALSSILPATVTAYDVWLYTVDAHLKYHGLSFIADYYWRYITQFNGAVVPSLFDHGFVLQSGYLRRDIHLSAKPRRSTKPNAVGSHTKMFDVGNSLAVLADDDVRTWRVRQ